MGNEIVKKLEAKYNIEDIEVKDLKNGKVQVFAVSDDFTKMVSPSLDESYDYDEIAQAEFGMDYNQLGPGEKEWVRDEIDNMSMNEAKKETGVDMAKKQLDALGVKYEMSTTDKVRPFKVIYRPINKSDEFYDTFEDIVDLFNLKGVVKSSMGEAKFMSGMLSGKDFINAKLKNYPKAKAKVNQLIDMIGEDKFTIEMAEWIFDFFNNAHFESPINEAKEEDKVDTITMDVPLFIRMLEYSREDAAEDMDLHDVTEKAISLGKERGILQMDDYDEIIGDAEEIKEAVNLKQSKLSSAEYQQAKKLKDFKASDWKWNASEDLYTKIVKEGMGGQLDEPYFVEVSVRDARIAMDMFDDRYRRSNIKMYGSNVYAANTPEDIYDLYYDFQNQDIEVLDYNVDGDLDEATDYMKRRKAMDDYAVSKKDKPAKPYNPNPSGKTDYMKRREKDLSERINEAFDKINEELCPAGKAYRKRRIAAGEKSSAYLSGRAVKVCKGQMSGKKKKK
jgi:hypothetical protein